MSGSYGVLNQKYNTLLALILKGNYSASSYQSGYIDTIVVGVATFQSFDSNFTSNDAPLVFLTYDNGSGSTTIINVGLAGITGGAGAWTGFNYLASATGSATAKIYWIATN
jgi:hypothetical protein